MGSTVKRTTEEEDRGLEYYIYQQSARNKRKRTASRTEKRNCFRCTWCVVCRVSCVVRLMVGLMAYDCAAATERPSLQSAKPLISGDMKRIIEESFSDDASDPIPEADHDEREGEENVYVGRQHSEESHSAREDSSNFMDQFRDEELLNDLLPMKLAIRHVPPNQLIC